MMKGLQGLVVAGALGIIAAALNWVYLEGQSQSVGSLDFLGVREAIMNGEVIQDRHLIAVTVPAVPAGSLKATAYLYADLKTVVGIKATKNYQVGDLILRADYRTPPAELRLEKNEKLYWIPVNSNTFVPDLINPGDEIAFVVPSFTRAIPEESPAASDDASETASTRDVSLEQIGPFRVGSLGNRLASSNLAKSNRIPTSEERLIGIVVSETKPEWSQAQRLYARVLAGEYQNIGVVLLRKRS